MYRRDFLALTAAVTLAAPVAARAEGVAYKPGLIDSELAAGKVVFVDYFATWCGTCAVQQRVIKSLLAENPAYGKSISFVEVDWDKWQNDVVTTGRSVPRRSTLLVLKGDKEIARLIAGTGREEIKALLDTGLAEAGRS